MITALLTSREVTFGDFEFITSNQRPRDLMEDIFNDVAVEVAEYFNFSMIA